MGSSKRRSSGTSQDLKKRIKIKPEPSVAVDLTDFYKDVLKAVSDMKDGVHSMSFQFLKLPQKKIYPDYYQVITKPISLHEIKEKANKKQYASIQEFEADFELMHTNAVTFNEQGSQIANDAELIFKFVQDQVKQRIEQDELVAKNNELREFESYRNEFEQGLDTILEDLIKHKVKHNRRPSELFMDEPSIEDYPEYFEVITSPMAFNTMKKKLSQHKYHQLQEFVDDMELVYNNARLFNQEGSQVYVDANTLEKLFKAKLEKMAATLAERTLPEGYHEWAITEQPISVTSASSSSPFSAAKGEAKQSIKLKLTPKSPVAPAQKLKINLGKLGRSSKKPELTKRDGLVHSEDDEMKSESHEEHKNDDVMAGGEDHEDQSHDGNDNADANNNERKLSEAAGKTNIEEGRGGIMPSVEPEESKHNDHEENDIASESQTGGDGTTADNGFEGTVDEKEAETNAEGDDGVEASNEVEGQVESSAVEEPVAVYDDRLRSETIPLDQALISEICLSSVLPSGRHQFQKNFLSGTIAQQDPFQIRIPASRTHVYQSFTYTLPSHHNTLSMNMLLHHSLASRAYQLGVTLNGNVVNPLSIHTGSLWGDDNDGTINKPINGRFELRLSPGLNHIECHTHAVPMVVVQPNGSEKPMRQSTLQHYIQTGDIEKQLDSERFVFWVNLSPGI